jgi:hypothetical protein
LAANHGPLDVCRRLGQNGGRQSTNLQGKGNETVGALVHNVFFSLADNSEAAKARLIASCKKYLTGHPGEFYFAVGTVAQEYSRPVNDRDFDVSLHVIFQDRPAHDAYQRADRHLTFIEENKSNWKKVRVFDSDADS